MPQFKVHVEERSSRTGIYYVEADSWEEALFEFNDDPDNDLYTDFEGPYIDYFGSRYVEEVVDDSIRVSE